MDADLLGTLACVFFGLKFADWIIIDDDIVKIDLRCVITHDLKVMTRRKTVGFSRLSHQIAYEYLNCL